MRLAALLLEWCSDASRREVDTALGPAVNAENEAVRGLRLVSVLDFENALCGRRSCTTNLGTPMYRDQKRLSVPGSLLLTGRFEGAIRARVR